MRSEGFLFHLLQMLKISLLFIKIRVFLDFTTEDKYDEYDYNDICYPQGMEVGEGIFTGKSR